MLQNHLLLSFSFCLTTERGGQGHAQSHGKRDRQTDERQTDEIERQTDLVVASMAAVSATCLRLLRSINGSPLT